jgi:basic membrane lipoprotein Med (substrate-binding protein (PBP1-ABC) superfamily)
MKQYNMKRSYIEISQPTQEEEIIYIINKIKQEYYFLLYGIDYNINNDLSII